MQIKTKKHLAKKEYSTIQHKLNFEDVNKSIIKNRNRQKIKELQFEIKSCQDSIKRLFAFACGERRFKKYKKASLLQTIKRTEDDDRILLKTVAYLREKIEHFEHEITILRRGIV